MDNQPQSLPDQIRSALLDQIVSGQLKPGDRLIELTIAKAHGTSQAPVREALRELEALGIIQMRRNRGAVVRAISEQETREIYAVRAELEGYAAALVADMAPNCGPDLIALCDRMDRAIEAGDVAGFVDLNTAFHRLIVESSGNSALLKTWETLAVQARTALNTARNPLGLGDANAGHRDIANAIRAGKAQAARAATVTHIIAVVR